MPRMQQRAENYTNLEYFDMFRCFTLSNENPEEARKMYQEKYPNREIPEAPLFAEVDRRLQETGSVREEIDGDDPNLPIEDRIQFHYNKNPTARMKPISQRLFTSQWNVWQAIYNKTKGSLPNDPNAEQFGRKQIVKFLYDSDAEDRNFLTSILWTGETKFGKEDFINISQEKEANKQTGKAIAEDFNVTVWMGILKNKLYGPYFLPNILTDSEYLEFLQFTLENLLIENFDIIYQHDGGSEYFGELVKEYLDEKFYNKWMSKDGPIPWARNCSELSPLDYNIWPKMWSLVYNTSPINTIGELMVKIKNAAKEIQKTLKIKVVESDLRKRLQFCLKKGGNNDEQEMAGSSSMD